MFHANAAGAGALLSTAFMLSAGRDWRAFFFVVYRTVHGCRAGEKKLCGMVTRMANAQPQAAESVQTVRTRPARHERAPN